MKPMLRTLPALALCAASAAPAAITTYTDPAAFLAAAQAIPHTQTLTENFSGPLMKVHLQDYSNFPHYDPMGVLIPPPSIYGYPAKVTTIGGGQLNGCIGYNCNDVMNVTTVWTFTKPVFAFAATFAYTDKQAQSLGIGGFQFSDGFFGFISTDAINNFVFRAADNPNNPCLTCRLPPTVHYTMQLLEFQQSDGSTASVPEPSTAAMVFGIPLFFLLAVLFGPRLLKNSGD